MSYQTLRLEKLLKTCMPIDVSSAIKFIIPKSLGGFKGGLIHENIVALMLHP
jgi:hypothetical protein